MESNQRFDSHLQWVHKASSWLTRHPDYNERFYRAICFDSIGRICINGGDFKTAKDEGTFPIHWIWPDQNLFERIDAIRLEQQNDKTD